MRLESLIRANHPQYRRTEPTYAMSRRESTPGRQQGGFQTPVKTPVRTPVKTPVKTPKGIATPNTTTARNTSTYDTSFQDHLISYEVYPPGHTLPGSVALPQPDNLVEIREQIFRRRRPSLDPTVFTDRHFDAFRDAEALQQGTKVTATVVFIIEGNVNDRRCTCAARQKQFRNLDALTNGSLVPGNPDRYYGALPDQLHAEVCAELGGRIVPSTQGNVPVAPNFFLLAKGPDVPPSVVRRQACYVGALGARGIHSLQSYGRSEQQYDNTAYNLTATYHDGHLKMYTTHLIPPLPQKDQPGYVMTLVDTWSLTHNTDAFREGVAAFRNGIDWAEQQRERAIQQANEKAAEAEAHPSDDGSGAEAEASSSDAGSGPEAEASSTDDDGLGLNFASLAIVGDTISTSHEIVPGLPSAVAPAYESDTSADK